MRLAATAFALALFVLACSPHKRRIDQARVDGNEPLAECYETCHPDDEACAAGCTKTFPTKWYHRYAGAVKPFIEAGMLIEINTAVALHPIAVQDARSHNPPLAECYDACEPTDARCLRACDAERGSDEDKQRRREMYMQVAKAGLELYLADRQQRAARRPRPSASSSSSASSGSPRTSSSSSSSSSGSSSSGSSGRKAEDEGSCTCKGYPLGHRDAQKDRAPSCSAMSSDSSTGCNAMCKAQGCDTQCKASGYAIGLYRGYGGC